MTKSPSVWIVVLNWNGLADTLDCLRSLKRLRYRDNPVVVVDNGSTDGSVEALGQEGQDNAFTFVKAGRNLGYAGGNNLGIRYALDRNADYILVLNNDTTVDPMLLDELVAAADRHPEGGCFGPWIHYMDEPERLWFARASWSPESLSFSWPGKDQFVWEVPGETTHTDYVCGAALFFRASVARQIGLLEERFFLVYEESDWCFRARHAGFECLTVPTARVWHKVGSSFGSEESPLRTYFSTRNKLLWAERNVSRRQLFGLLRRAGRRLYPEFRVVRQGRVPWHKTVLWACVGFAREWSHKLHDPQEAAHRRGLFDYMLRRFGDCPSAIRELTDAWARAHEAHGTHGKGAN